MQVRRRIVSILIYRTSIFLVTAGLILSSVAPLPAAQTFSYEPETINIVGTLQKEVFPGPPNYENVRSGDSPETVWFVAVDDDGEYTTEIGGQRIQIILPIHRYEHLLNRTVVATGTLFDGHTVHHHTPVLMFVTELHTLLLP